MSAICPGVINTGIIDATRYLGVDERTQARNWRAFQRGHRPEQVAEAVVGAVVRDRAVVPVGWEATLGWWLHRLAPVRLQQLIARQGP